MVPLRNIVLLALNTQFHLFTHAFLPRGRRISPFVQVEQRQVSALAFVG